jgi:hypothetical protein
MAKTKKSTNKRKRVYTISNTRQKKHKPDKDSDLDKTDENETNMLKNLFDKFVSFFN